MWYYDQAGVPSGPVDETELRQQIQASRLDPDTLIWREGMGDWAPARQMLQNLVLPPPPPPTAGPRTPQFNQGAVGSNRPTNPYQGPTNTPYRGVQKSGNATTSMILGIVSLVVMLVLCFISIFTCIPGIIFGHKAKSEIRASNGALQGNEQATAGLIMNYIVLALNLAFIAFIVIAIISDL